jgi:hypothetical protein
MYSIFKKIFKIERKQQNNWTIYELINIKNNKKFKIFPRFHFQR